MEKAKKKNSVNPLLRTRIKSASVKIFPETLFGYLGGPVLALISNAIVNVYLIQYWDKILGLKNVAYRFEFLLPIISAIIIVAGNLFVGRLIEKHASAAGKARPWILVSMPLIAIALLILFLVPIPQVGANNFGILAMIAIGYNLFYALAFPFYYTSHSALVSLSTRDSAKRGLLATACNAAQLGAAGLAGMVGPFFVSLLGLLPDKKHFEGDEAAYTAAVEAANHKWVILMIVVICLMAVGCLLEFYFTRERITEEKFAVNKSADEVEDVAEDQEAAKVPMLTQIKVALHDKYWWMIMGFFLLYQLGGMLKNNSVLFYSQAFTGDEMLAGTINTVGALPTALGMLAIWPLSNKFGKAKCIKVGGFVAAIMGIVGFAGLLPGMADNTGAIYGISIAGFCLKALGTVPAMYISLALLADVLDHEEAVSGVRTDGFSMAVYGSIMIAMTGIANGIILGIHGNVEVTGSVLDQQICTWLFFGGEAICYLIIGIIFMFMDVEKFSKIDHETIIADAKARAEKEGRVFIAPEQRLKDEEAASKAQGFEDEKADLKKKCDAKGLNYEQELRKLEADHATKEKAAAEKKAAADKKKADAEAAKKAELDAKIAQMSPSERAEYNADLAAKAEKQAARDAAILAEFNAIREKNHIAA